MFALIFFSIGVSIAIIVTLIEKTRFKKLQEQTCSVEKSLIQLNDTNMDILIQKLRAETSKQIDDSNVVVLAENVIRMKQLEINEMTNHNLCHPGKLDDYLKNYLDLPDDYYDDTENYLYKNKNIKRHRYTDGYDDYPLNALGGTA